MTVGGRRLAAAGGGSRRRLARVPVRVVVVALGTLVLAGCATRDLPQNVLAPEGPVARAEDNLWNLVFPIAVGVFILVQGLLLYALVRFRARRTDEPGLVPKQVSGNTRLEVMWTIVPALILASIAVPTVKTVFDLSAEPEGALQVRVVGKQYWWEFEYLGDEGQGIVTANELYIPVGRPVLLLLESTGQANADPLGVIHSFWVPKLAGKQDVVPGHVRELSLEAERPGVYPGQCAEFCGLSHANMRLAVFALEPADFEAWVEEHSSPQPPPEEDLAAQGAELFAERQCIACHAINGYENATARVGPDLTHFADREKFAGYILPNDVEEGPDGAEVVSAWLRNPQAVKPGAQMPNLQLSDEEIDALVAYLATLQ